MSSMLALALRTYARYVVPLTVLSVLVFAPLLWFVLQLPSPVDAAQAKQLFRLAWIIAGGAWLAQLVLVGAVAPAVRGIASGEPLSQVRAFTRGGTNALRMAVPCAVAIAAIVVGGVALVLPGIALVVLLALTGASTFPGLPAPLHDSIAVVRANLRAVVLVVVAILVVDQGIPAITYLVFAQPLAKKPTPEQLDSARQVVQVVAVALAIISPIGAAVLASIRARHAPE